MVTEVTQARDGLLAQLARDVVDEVRASRSILLRLFLDQSHDSV